MDLTQRIAQFQETFYKELEAAATPADLEQIRVAYLARKGMLNDMAKQLPDLSQQERRELGPQIKQIKQEAHEAFSRKRSEIEAHEKTHTKRAHLDVTAYTPFGPQGSLHPYTHMTQEMSRVLTSMGFHIMHAPEVDSSHYNFETLNIPEGHPAREMHDTFWIDIPGLLLRTHTSTIQGRILEDKQPPIAVVAPGRAYRHEATDASHDIMFMQCEGLLVDHDISLSHLFATMKSLLQALFYHHRLEMRVRPGYFPFVEPGVEIDISCPFCATGCSTCSQTQWIEICGAGLVHPRVLEMHDLDPDTYSGFAFGFGLTRLAMLKYGIDDIRWLHGSSMAFLKQFP